MFKETKENYADEIETIIGNSVNLEGDFSSQGNISINGKVCGKISTGKDMNIEEAADVKADLVAKNIVVAGKVEGNVKADRLEIKENGKVLGDVNINAISIAEGACFLGNCSMNGEAGEDSVNGNPPEEEK